MTAEGKIQKEVLGILDGSAATQEFFTKQFPITTGAGVTTDAETEVDVFTDDGTPGSWTEYQDDGSDFNITGATGSVVIAAAENQAGNAGEEVSISYYTIREVGRGQNVALDFETEIFERYDLGSRLPQELKEGKISIGGNVGSFHVNKSMLGLVLSKSSFYKRAVEMTFIIYPNGKVAGQPYIKCTDTKFSRGHLETSTDAVTLTNMDFKALAIEIGTVS